ncbi:TetR/AcrR family transcriptional regulator [Anoxybacillus sp. LAT_35]|uniref:TetR/AcrR family transcriptional regulator n=1 Tax=unclassified Anoxybacillus TaxID=2639704 RepID=UPI001EDB0647|nr:MULTISPECIES: TetR/AcrR family transcriptional regulator [unclassified Anoxybacillus]MCG5025051.1 TetR/AcrR family transcriptional regulator [Anoxybacillus flavithermus]MCG6195985.1 TetR/AcrR family transcriptional regulator [Anoxybacillus sp. LAT_38]MCG3083612.1 TetR/AcrR family transcriptional regulator [Anoxybacillus sp. LAT27]MCG6170285.1 TetR/AcrR family transcriptional regulator [Anoxybacillus sp. LAT_11]MCG6174816.1 TetR/AcrR family transcriptional regulator [Anoxybacillus sp. LAT_31
MYEAFERQPEEKKKLIIQTVIEEFVQNGYDNASTDVMTSRAGISKGLLFHYFKSKKNLYLYVVHYAKQLLTEKTMEAVNEIRCNDFFERIKQIVLTKQQIFMKYPRETQLVIDAVANPPKAVKKEMEQLLAKHYETYAEDFQLQHIFLKDLLHKETLRDDVCVETVVRMTMLIVEQLSNKYMQLYKHKQYDPIRQGDLLVRELDEYVDVIKYGIYK